jgi:hypothetical protein
MEHKKGKVISLKLQNHFSHFLGVRELKDLLRVQDPSHSLNTQRKLVVYLDGTFYPWKSFLEKRKDIMPFL